MKFLRLEFENQHGTTVGVEAVKEDSRNGVLARIIDLSIYARIHLFLFKFLFTIILSLSYQNEFGSATMGWYLCLLYESHAWHNLKGSESSGLTQILILLKCFRSWSLVLVLLHYRGSPVLCSVSRAELCDVIDFGVSLIKPISETYLFFKIMREEKKVLFGKRMWELGEERLVKLIVEKLREAGGGRSMKYY